MSFLLLFTLTLYSQQQAGTLSIRAGHFMSDSGKAVVHLFRENDDIPKKPFKVGTGLIMNGTSDILFENIQYGEYAAILFHDENANGELDHKFFFPAEPMGFSNGWELTLFSGMPDFKELRFEFSESKEEYEIFIRQ